MVLHGAAHACLFILSSPTLAADACAGSYWVLLLSNQDTSFWEEESSPAVDDGTDCTVPQRKGAKNSKCENETGLLL